MIERTTRISLVAGFLFGAIALAADTSAAQSGRMELEAQLILVTDRPQSSHPRYKAVEPAIAARLRHMPFRWKHFYEVNRVVFTVSLTEPKMIQLSRPYRLAVKGLGPSGIEVSLFGQTKLVNTTKQPLSSGELLIMGADDKGTNTWLVVVRAASRELR